MQVPDNVPTAVGIRINPDNPTLPMEQQRQCVHALERVCLGEPGVAEVALELPAAVAGDEPTRVMPVLDLDPFQFKLKVRLYLWYDEGYTFL
jgi:hypothetical protein